jgi:serine/threonine protein kinase/Tol biopolymer transport system component
MLTGQQFGRYEIRSKIGEGGMGEVYTALDAELGRSVAIKILPSEFTTDPDRRSRFRQEARVISALNHPNIITIYEIGENEYGSYLATELVEGRTLREVLKSESLTLSRILRIVEQAANALVAAHAAHIIHRDVKPENIMLRRDAIVKVLDFGLAKPKEDVIRGSDSSNKTVPGTVMGSARYMSPEQARGQEVDERTDIWSLGVVMYEMLSGRTPFEGETSADTMAAVIYKEPEPLTHVLPHLPNEVQRILRKSLQKDREDRYQSVKDFALDVRDVLFELEHSNSGDRIRRGNSSPEFLENPTIIHRTVSANHPTGETTSLTSHYGLGNEQAVDRKILKPAMIAALSLLILAAAGYGIYSLIRKQPPTLVAGAFEKAQVTRISTDGKVIMPAISPDGRYVAYVAGEIGNQSLVVRQVATDSQVTAVPATNLKLQNVTFSTDGDHVYYTQTNSDFAVSTLYQVPTLGGSPKKMIEDVDGAAAFSPDGKQFAFVRHATDNNTDNIYIVDTATLATQPLISSKDTPYDFFTYKMAWSPDGRHILLGAGKRQSSFVVSTDLAQISIADKKLEKLNANKEFFGLNSFVWLDDGSGFLFVGRETQNSPVQIWRSSYPAVDIHQVTNDFNDYLDLSLSADGRSFVTVKSDASSSLWRYTPATKAADQITAEGRNIEGSAGLTPMPGDKLLFTHIEGKDSDIWASDADGKNAKALITGPGFMAAPVVTPDGRYIVYNLQKDKTSRIFRSDADGKNSVQLTKDDLECADFYPQLTPDGKWVIFHRMVSGDDRGILMKVPIEGGSPEVFYENPEMSAFSARISHDGKRIAWISYNVKTWQKKMQIATLDGSSFGKIERELDYNLVNTFAWAPDDRSLTVLTSRAGIQNLWQQPIDGSTATPITSFKSGRVMNFAWSSDGKSIYLSRGNTNNDLILFRDTARTPLTPDSAKRRAYQPIA